ncbi:MAG: pilus assembly PilX N-terminal domain-containing protein [bacterium]|nr:pilus assembly PilX N-terminal domain-containing protein [bacterium]
MGSSNKNKTRGAVLIMTMMAICLTFMMIYTVVQTSGVGLSTSSSFYDREAALAAAQSGLDYAVTQMQLNRDWKGDSNRKYWHNSGDSYKDYSNEDFKVIESNGNVVGLLTSKGGYKTAFRIKFNYEFTTKEIEDGCLKDVPRNTFSETIGGSEPITSIPIDMPYVSINNFNNAKEALMYRANTDGKGINFETANLELTGKDDTTRLYANHVPPQRSCIIVEGLSGYGLRNCTTPEQILQNGKNEEYNPNRVVRRYVESYYTFNAPLLKGFAVYAKGELQATVPNNMLVKSVGYQSSEYKIPSPGSLCSGSKISIDGKLCTHNGTVYSPITPQFTTDDTTYKYARYSGKSFKQKFFKLFGKNIEDYKEVQFQRAPIEILSDADKEKVYELNESHLASASNSSGNQLRSGLYQWHLTKDSTDTDKSYELRYYPKFTIDDTTKQPIPNSDYEYKYEIIVASLSDDPTQNQVTIQDAAGKDVTIKKSLLIDNAPKGKISLGLGSDTDKITSPVLNLSGEVYCGGDLAIGADLSEIKNVCPTVNINTYIPPSSTPGQQNNKKTEGVLMAAGDMTLLSTIKGSGAIVAKDSSGPKDIKLIGESALSSNSTGIAVYGKDINLMSLDMATTANLADKGNGQGTSGTGSEGEYKPYTNDAVILNDYNELYTLYTNGSLNNDPQSCGFDLNTAKTALANYYAAKHATIEVESGHSTSNGFTFTIKFLKTTGGDADSTKLTITFDASSPDVQLQAKMYDGGTQYTYDYTGITEWTIPESSYIPYIPGTNNSPTTTPTINDDIEEDGTYVRSNDYSSKGVCYGDQVFNGVICATDNFKADLKGYKLIINGALRAEGTSGTQSGTITLDCDNVDLTYDEECVAKLLPRYCGLTCELWNCW